MGEVRVVFTTVTDSTCVSYTEGGCETLLFYEPDPADPAGQAPPQPGDLARRALAVLELPLPELGLSPPPDVGDPNTLVNTATHLWLTPTGSSQTGPHTASATDRGLTVTITATLDHLTVSADDTPTPAVVSCGLGDLAEPPTDPFTEPLCGHTWTHTSTDEPGDVFTLTVTHHWTATWTGGGQSGTLSTQTTTTYPIAVTDHPITLHSQARPARPRDTTRHPVWG
ncbi:hypothetical protein [Salana multivorans]